MQVKLSKGSNEPPLESPETTEMICSILRFLEASPARLLDDISGVTPSSGFFDSFLCCVLSPDPSVRRLATSIADRLFTGHLEAYRKFDTGHQFGTQELRGELWTRRSVSTSLRFLFNTKRGRKLTRE